MASKARILILTPQLPSYPPTQGTTIRNYNLIKALAATGRYDLLLLSFSDKLSQEGQAEAHLRELGVRVELIPSPIRTLQQRLWDTFTSALPDMGLRLAAAPMHHRLTDLLDAEPFDIVQVEGIEMAPYLWQVAQRPGAHPKLLFDDHNAEYVLQRRAFETDIKKSRRWPGAVYSLIQWQKLRRYERRIVRTADAIIAVSEADAKAIQQLVPEANVTVVPNGVALDYYQEAEDYAPLKDRPALVFTGKMDFRPNVDAILWFTSRVWPRLRAEMPQIHLYVVGKDPHPRLATIAREPGITITGFVPDIRPYIAGADVYIVPLRIGGGTRLKVLEALAMGKAIVSTTVGCEGIGLRSGQEALLADTPQDFAAAVLTLLTDKEQRQALAAAARQIAATHYDWQRIVPRLEALYADTA
jgi:sugar transferase (PEP-CTERM/EpsH1 system associated)